MTLRAAMATSRSFLRTALATAVFLAAAGAAPAATITVTGTGDTVAVDGLVTLREAITSIINGANVNADVVAVGAYGTNDTINFNIALAGVHTIQPTSALPIVTNPVTINGYSQPGASANTLAVGNDAVLLIEIDGTNAGAILGGLLEISAGSSTVRGLVINRAQGGNSIALRLTTNGGNTVGGNFIGMDPTGTITRPNGCLGLAVVSSNGNTIGGLSPGDRNVISGTIGCSEGLVINSSANNQVLNNYLGTNAAGTASLGSALGLVIATSGGPTTSTGNIIGGNSAAARNVISGNSTGIHMFDSGTSGNVILGNFIGTDASGSLGVGNGTGVLISESAHDNTIGGTTAGDGNTITFNTGPGVSLAGTAGTGNAILGNSIFSNGGLGIDLGSDGVTANDSCDQDTGPNSLQNYPLITNVISGGGTTVIDWSLNSTFSTPFRIEFFSSPSCDPSGFGEGKTLIGFVPSISTDSTCALSATSTITPLTLAPGSVVTMTATLLVPVVLRPLGGAVTQPSDTSEFSQCFTVPGGVQTLTPTNTPTVTPSPTLTPVGGQFTSTPTPPAAVVPTLSPSMLGLLGLALVAAALLLMRRP